MRIHYTVDKADDPEGWHGSVGHISKEMLQVGFGVVVFACLLTRPAPPSSHCLAPSCFWAAWQRDGMNLNEAAQGEEPDACRHACRIVPAHVQMHSRACLPQEHAFPPDDSKGGGGGGAYKGSGSDQQGQNGRSGGTIALICGPPPMVNGGCRGLVGCLNIKSSTTECAAPNERQTSISSCPPVQVEKACLPALRELGFDENHIIVF